MAGRGAGLFERSADSPLPKTLRCGFSGGLGTSQDLLCELDVAFGATRADVVGENGLAEAGGLGEANAAGDYRLKNVVLEEFAKILLHLAGQVHALVIHREQDAFNLERGVE